MNGNPGAANLTARISIVQGELFRLARRAAGFADAKGDVPEWLMNDMRKCKANLAALKEEADADRRDLAVPPMPRRPGDVADQVNVAGQADR